MRVRHLTTRAVILGVLVALCAFGCLGPARGARLTIPAGPFMMGSTPEEREYGYRLDEDLHNSKTARRNGWFEVEARQTMALPAYRIDPTPVTNAAYREFVQQTRHRSPFVTQDVWRSYRLIHNYDAVQRFLWRDNRPPRGREQHPVVLVSQADATAYCRWRGKREGDHFVCPPRRSGKRRHRAPMVAIFHGAIRFWQAISTVTTRAPSTRYRWGNFPTVRVPMACWIWLGRCSSGPRRRTAATRSATPSKVALGTIIPGSRGRRRATAAPPTSSTF